MTKEYSLFFILTIFGLLSCNDKNQILYPIQENGLFGFIDSTGNKLIEPQYLYVEKFNEELALAVVDTIHQPITFSDSLNLKSNGKSIDNRNIIIKYGFINKKNKFILPPIYTLSLNVNDIDFNKIDLSAFIFHDKLALLQDKDSQKYGYINQLGDTIIKCQYRNASPFSEGKAAVQKDFNEILPNEKYTFDIQSLKWGYINTKGEMIIDFQYLFASPFNNGIAHVVINSYFISDKDVVIKGNIDKNKKGENIINQSNNIILEKGSENTHFNLLLINDKGHVIKTFDSMMYGVYSFSNDSIAILAPSLISEFLNIGYSFINTKGERLKPFGDLNKYQINSIVESDSYIGFISDDIRILDVTSFSNGYAGVKLNDNTWYFVDKYLIIRSPKSYQNIRRFSNGLAAVKENNMWGFVDKNLEIIIPCKYDSCELFYKNLAKVYNINGGVRIESYINKKGETVWQKIEKNDIFNLNKSYNNKYSNKNESEFGKWRSDLIFSTEKKPNNALWIVICSILIFVFVLLYYFKTQKEKKSYLSNLIYSLEKQISNIGFDHKIKQLISEIDQIKKSTNFYYDWTLFEQLKEKANNNMISKVIAFEKNLIILEKDIAKNSIKGSINELINKLKQEISNPLYKVFQSRIENSLKLLSNIEEQNKIDQLSKAINNYKKEIAKKEIDLANEIEAEIISKIDDKIYISQKPKFEAIKREFEVMKRNGILISEDELYVKYDTPKLYVQDDNWNYPVSKFPKKGTIVWPFRRALIARRGIKEEYFEKEIAKYLSGHIHIYGDVNLLPQDGCRPYEPDIAIIDKSNYNIRIDIEIDEPYAGYNKAPTHYIGCGDELRDININNLGWIVIRFAESQIVHEPLNCISYIAEVIKSLNPNFQIPVPLKNISKPGIIKQWSQLDAQKLAAKGFREKYLDIKAFGYVETKSYRRQDLTLTDFEKRLTNKCQNNPLISSVNTNKFEGFNLLNLHKNDSSIIFDPLKHLYTFKGHKLHSVSEIISNYFPLFDVEYWSEKKSEQRGISQLILKEEWDCKGKLSRDSGTFLHKQIENYFLGLNVENKFVFNYNGNYIQNSTTINIDKELEYFKNFISDYTIKPYRTEWRIFDKKNMIAGTIDLISKNGETFDIYDWKRSENVFKNNPFQKGYGNLNHLESTRLNHYYLQQNLYKFILEENYGIKIGKMSLVVLHPNYSEYKIVPVPELINEIQYILNDLI